MEESQKSGMKTFIWILAVAILCGLAFQIGFVIGYDNTPAPVIDCPFPSSPDQVKMPPMTPVQTYPHDVKG